MTKTPSLRAYWLWMILLLRGQAAFSFRCRSHVYAFSLLSQQQGYRSLWRRHNRVASTRRPLPTHQVTCLAMLSSSSSSSSSSSNQHHHKQQEQEASVTRFGKFVIDDSSVFYNTAGTAAFVNLRPIVPGHVLVISKRVAARLQDLNSVEYTELWNTVRIVQQVLQQHYCCAAFNVAVQDGRAAGQSVPHVHVHILPRYNGDLERNDDVYDALEHWAPRPELKQPVQRLDVPEHEERRDRTLQEMADEAAVYRKLLGDHEQENDNM